MHQTRATTDRRRPGTKSLATLMLLSLWGITAVGAENACDVWTLPLLRDPDNPDALRVQLEHRDSRTPGAPWAFYAFVLPEIPMAPIPPLSVTALQGVSPPPRRLEALQPRGSHRPIRGLRDWYRHDPDQPALRWSLYLLRLGAADLGLDRLGLGVEPFDPGPPLSWGRSKYHGPLPPLVLELEPVPSHGFGEDALVCRARSPRR